MATFLSESAKARLQANARETWDALLADGRVSLTIAPFGECYDVGLWFDDELAYEYRGLNAEELRLLSVEAAKHGWPITEIAPRSGR